MKITGIILIIAGVAALLYGGFTYTTQKKAVDLGPLQVEKTEHHSVPLPRSSESSPSSVAEPFSTSAPKKAGRIRGSPKSYSSRYITNAST